MRELAERAGISGRTLRHYHQIGLLDPDRVGSNGYRYYGLDAVSRLQRILLLRETGMPCRISRTYWMQPQLLRPKWKHSPGIWSISRGNAPP
ncbi:MerR family transcriptional regulator [Arthrobacter koreensis]|uniref:MerR family transcriptional regulator n=1 Tax=Arthrobacter koreensis TaxID=199136 RepID=UPI003D8AD634